MENLNEKIRFKKPGWDPGLRNYGLNRWQAYSPKLGRRVKSYSDIEYNHSILVESNPDIISYCEQPVKILGHMDDKDCASYPDMWILWRDGTEEFREVKYAKDLDKPKVIRQIAIQKSWCEASGATHSIYTEREIYENRLLLANWKVILSQLTINKDLDLEKVQTQIMQYVTTYSKVSLGELLEYFTDVLPGDIHAAVFRLIHSGQLSAPLDKEELTTQISFEVRNEEKN